MVHITSVRYRNSNFSVLARMQSNGKMAIESINGHSLDMVPNLIKNMASVKMSSRLEAYNNPKPPVLNEEPDLFNEKYHDFFAVDHMRFD